MERLMVVASFQKAIDSLRTTECSSKEKLALFMQISDCIQSSGLRGNANYLSFISNAVSILLMFCEDIDSVVRMSAEENLNRIIRFSTPLNIVRIQYELFQEIKRNGNDRSLRIALNLFGHYAHMIKQRKVKPYALNLLPCILSISQRKEQQLIETLSTFLLKFCKHFQISLTENEVSNLIEYFVKDAISTECSVKRRCSASNVMTLIEHARRSDAMAKHALTLCLDNLVKDFTLNTIVGALGLLRILLPKIISTSPLDSCVVHKTIEIYEICLHLLNDTNHTVINASLECLCAILSHSKPQLTNYLASDKLIHMDVLCKKRTLKNQIFRRKLSSPSLDDSSVNVANVKTQKTSPVQKNSDLVKREAENSESTVAKNTLSYDDKGLLTGSDVELDSLRLNDFELCQSDESLLQLSEKNSPSIKKTSHEENRLKSQKSTDSIGSFLNQLMHSNTESVTKFFRVGTSSSQTSDIQTPNVIDDFEDELNQTDTNMSEQSDGSMLSLNSSALGAYDMLNKTDDSIPEIEILNEQEIASIRLEQSGREHEKSAIYATTGEQTVDTASNTTVEANVLPSEIPIGGIGNQPLIYYTIRLISSKFLLYGTSYKLNDGFGVRISIKNSSLAVIGHCVAICPRSLLLSLQYNGPENLAFDQASDSEDSECSGLEKASVSKDNQQQPVVEPSDELNIKDDHFGESSKVAKTYFDFSFPLSKSADNVLLSRLSVSSSMTGADGSNLGDHMKRTQKLSGDLHNLLSKSEIIESNRSYNKSNLDVTIESDIDSNEKLLCNQSLIQSMTNSSPQFVEDLLLFWNHSDPVLRANIQTLVGNFLFNVLNECNSIANYIEKLEIASTYRFLNFNILFHILLKGLSDEIHTVVKQSLISLDKILSVLLDHRSDWFYSGEIYVQPKLNGMEDDDTPKIECKRIISPIQLFEEIFETLPLVFENRYWTIQNRYCHSIAAINYSSVEKIFGHDKTQSYKKQFLSQIYQMLSDSDARVRNEAANALFELYCSPFIDKNHKNNSILEFVAEILSNEVPFSLNNPMEPLNGFHLGVNNNKQQIKRVLGKYLFDLVNMLFALKSSEQMLGATKCLLNTMNAFHPIQFVDIWCEYNILGICIELLTLNYSTGTDLSCQCDLLTISSNLLAAIALRKSSDLSGQHKAITLQLLKHVMKILSIYHNVLNNKRPVFIPKGQKTDLFVNSRELQLINSYGYFGNDYFYLKIYKIVRIIFENYKITINQEIDAKLFSLLNTCLKTMTLLLEIMDPFTNTEMTIFFDEILMYIKTFLIYVIEPKMSVICIKHLIRNMFQMTFPNWKIDVNLFDFEQIHTIEPIKLFEYLNTIRCKSPVLQKKMTDSTASTHTGSKLINFLAATSTPEKHKANPDHRNIKLFEPIVIQCLKLFTKSDAEMQSYILDMLCQVLQLKVNYCLLDANNIFMDFILKLIESIEMGIIRNSDILTPKIVKFLFFLAKQKDKPQMSIPKIINVTDNLLANSITNNGSVEALYHLAFEIYFPRYIDGDSDEPQQTIKELNTQKEVVFSMLLKFISYFKIKKMICMILAKETKNSKETHAELTECFLHMLSDEKPFLNDMSDYYVVKEMCSNINSCLLCKNENASRLLARFQTRNNSIFDDIAIKSIILECISQAADESVIMECIAPETLAECIQNDFSINIAYNAMEYNLLFEGELDQIMEYLQIFGNYLHGIIQVLRNCDKIGQILRRKFIKNPKNCETLSNFMRNLSVLNSPSHAKRTNWCRVKSKFASQLFTLIFDLYEISCLLENMANVKTASAELVLTHHDPCIVLNLIEFIVSRLINDATIKLLLNNFFTKILLIEPKFITCVVQKPEFFELILNKLKDLLKLNTSQKNIPYLYLDILEASQNNALVLNVNHLQEIMEIYRKDAAILRRSFKILNDRLVGLNVHATDQLELISVLKQFKVNFQHYDMFFLVAKSIENIITENYEKLDKSREMSVNIPIDENWFVNEAVEVIKSKINKQRIFEILCDVKSEQKLSQIYETTRTEFDGDLLSHLIECSIRTMIKKFKHDCFQHNPHMNYLKLSPILKQSINLLCNKMDNIFDITAPTNENDNQQSAITHYRELKEIIAPLRNLLRCILSLQLECMIYVEVTAVKKFMNEHIFQRMNFQRLIKFASICLDFVGIARNNDTITMNIDDLTIACDCLTQIIRMNFIFNESNNYFSSDKCHDFFNQLLETMYEIVYQHMASQTFLGKNQLEQLLNKYGENEAQTTAHMQHAKAIFLGLFVENSLDTKSMNHSCTPNDEISHLNSFEETLLSLIITTMRSDLFYFFAVTPREIINSFEWQCNSSSSQTITFQSVPIDCLNEIEIVEKFLKRINIFGFPSRLHFEEFFMSLLVLLNKENDANIVDAEEEYQIKSMCMLALLELLISCKMFPIVGDRLNGQFHHVPRLERLKADSIGSRKLHEIQNSLMSAPSVFYIPNLEYCSQRASNIIGTHEFQLQQNDLNVIWHIIEGQPAITRCIDVELKNMKHFIETSLIDFASSIQLTFDVICQLSETNSIQTLQHIVKFSELCENRDHFHWIKDTMSKLHESIPFENVIAHQHIAYCLCRSYAILIPSLADLSHLCPMLRDYLKSAHLFVRVATLKGLLLLFESCIKSNTTIGSLSEEIVMLRTFISSYITQYGIIEESTLTFSNEHNVLVWTLNFYVIECTSKYIPECELVTNTIISANNVLKRTTSLTLYSCIIHGLERVIISRTTNRFFHEKIEKLALDLVKLENEQFSLLALKLLVTCMYIGANEQLENTEKCNGIVQDEPEVIMLSTEKIEILFQRIKSATRPAAHIYGNVLCQITHDLVPPKEVLTKVIKEFLTVSQPHCEVIAKILFEVFRSAIDSAYLPMLQDWLLCSLPNFLSFSTQKIMWYLIVIFISASINLSLIKIFPQVLADYNMVFNNATIQDKYGRQASVTQVQSYESSLCVNDERVAKRQQFVFALACKDFYDRLNNQQKSTFRDIFSKIEELDILNVL